MKADELRNRQRQVKKFSTEWFQLKAQIEEALAEEARAKTERLPAVTDEQIHIADYVNSRDYDDD